MSTQLYLPPVSVVKTEKQRPEMWGKSDGSRPDHAVNPTENDFTPRVAVRVTGYSDMNLKAHA